MKKGNKNKIGTFEIIDIELVKPSEINRALNETHIESLSDSIDAQGMIDVMVVDNDNYLLDRHHTYYGALKQGLKKVPVYRLHWLKNLTQEQRLKVILIFNSKKLNWSNKDYLEKYALIKTDYEKTLNKFVKYRKNLSLGTIRSIYMIGDRKKFINGDAKFRQRDIEKCNFMAETLMFYTSLYTKRKVLPYITREIISACHRSKDIKRVKFILDGYQKLIEKDSQAIQSGDQFRPALHKMLNAYEKQFMK